MNFTLKAVQVRDIFPRNEYSVPMAHVQDLVLEGRSVEVSYAIIADGEKTYKTFANFYTAWCFDDNKHHLHSIGLGASGDERVKMPGVECWKFERRLDQGYWVTGFTKQ